MKPVKKEEFRFRKHSGVAMMSDLTAFSRYVAKKLGFNVSVDGMEIMETADGIHIRGGMGSAAVTCPFDGAITTTDSGVFFRFSNVGSLYPFGMPSNMFVSGQLLSFNVSSGGWIKLRVESIESNINSVTIVFEPTPAAPIGLTENHAPDTFDIDLWGIVDGKAYKACPCGNPTVNPDVALTTSKADPECGEDPIVRHYTWSVAFY